MTKLQKTVQGQIIQITEVPKYITKLTPSLPSGKIELSNGKTVYWKFSRNLAELKHVRGNFNKLSNNMAEALQELISSPAFKSEHGDHDANIVIEERRLDILFNKLLTINNNRVNYTATYRGKDNDRIETLGLTFGNMVFLNASRGIRNPYPGHGIGGVLMLDENNPDTCYDFHITSPVIELEKHISPDNMSREILYKLRTAIPNMIGEVKIVYFEHVFDGYTESTLKDLVDKHRKE